MKKYLLLLIITALLNIPAFSACKINGICTANNNTNFEQKIDKQKLNESKKTTVSQETQSLDKPYINSSPQMNYNANCQFGICLPKKIKLKN